MPVFFNACFYDRTRLYEKDVENQDKDTVDDEEFDFELTLGEKIFSFFTNSSGLSKQSPLKVWARFFDAFTCFMVTFAVVLFLISSLPKYRHPKKLPAELEGLQIFTFIYFTIEYLPKFILAGWCRWEVLNTALYYPREGSFAEDKFEWKKMWKILVDPLLLIDLLATMPFWIGLAAHSDVGGFSVFLRVLRLTRVARVIQLFVKSSRFRKEGALLYRTLAKTTHQLFRLFVYYSLAALVIGTLIFFVERGELKTIDGVEGFYVKDVSGNWSPSLYSSVFDGAWWFLITGTSVGYGDVYPKTHLGRIISVFAIMIGLIAIALPIGMIQAQFQILHFQEVQKDNQKGDRSALSEMTKILDDRDERLLKKFVELLDARSGAKMEDYIDRMPSSEKIADMIPHDLA
jgi:hypothetical protein